MTNIKSTALAGLAGLFVLTACTDINTATNDPNQRTKEGVAVGAVAGALAGILSGDDSRDRRRGAILGAVIGGGVGAAIGNNLDKQAAELQSAFGDDRIQIINTGDELIVRMPQDILFAVDSSTVGNALRSDLRALADNLQRYPGSTVVVNGHTDSTGSASHNLSLSQGRADAVAAVLISNGVPSGRVRPIGRGEHEPIATNQTSAGRAQNRRVDIVIRPNG
ncbi:MAG: OmpA family protein [Marinosulfonomonas sp.]|nr:OmpA family protein [Marinosulfonomonas sp.]